MGFLSFLGDSIIHSVEHTVNATIDGVSQTVKVVTNAAGEAANDVVSAGKVIIKAGTKIH